MFAPRFASFLWLALFTASLATGNESSSWETQLHAARQLCQDGRFADAAKAYENLACQMKQAGAQHQLVARVYDELAISLKVTGRYDEAEKNYLRALDLIEHAQVPFPLQRGVILSDLGAFYVETGQLARAERYLLESRDVLLSTKSAPYFCQAAVVQNLGALFYHQGRLEQAEQQFRAALTMLHEDEPLDRPQFGVILSDLSQILVSENRAREAEPLVSKAISIFETLNGRFQSNFYAVLVVDANAKRALGQIEAAGASCDRALNLGDRILGPENPRLLGALDLCSAVYKADHRRKEAKQLASREQAMKLQIATHSTAAQTVDVATLMKQNAQ